jgi:hypothetical protein
LPYTVVPESRGRESAEFGLRPESDEEGFHTMDVPWSVQVLTGAFVAEGTFDPKNKQNSGAMAIFRASNSVGAFQNDTAVTFRLTHFESLHSRGSAAGAGPEFTLFPHSLVAVIPRDEAGTQYVTNNSSAGVLIPSDIFVGPFVIHGSVLAPSKDVTPLRQRFWNIAVKDAAIEYQTVESGSRELHAGLAVVRTEFMHAICVRA